MPTIPLNPQANLAVAIGLAEVAATDLRGDDTEARRTCREVLAMLIDGDCETAYSLALDQFDRLNRRRDRSAEFYILGAILELLVLVQIAEAHDAS